MMRLGFDIKLLSTLRAIAVVGFVLMSRLKDVSFKDLYTQEKVEPPVQVMSAQELPAHQVTPPHFTVEEVALLLSAFSQQSESTLKQAPQGTALPSQAPFTETAEQRKQGNMQHQDGTVPAQVVAQTLNAEMPIQLRKAMVPAAPSPLLRQQDSPAGEPIPPAAPQGKITGAQDDLVRGIPARGIDERVGLREQPRHLAARHGIAEGHADAELPRKPLQLGTVAAVGVGERRAVDRQLGVVLREERLERAFQSLIAEGKKPSGRALAERAHVHRSTCITWLQVRQQKTPLTEQKSAEL